MAGIESGRALTDQVGYEVYVRSFADSDGNGVGDIAGITDHLDYLAWLGIDLLWLAPFFPSPMADHGYDVANYTDVDPVFGNLHDVENLVRRAHERGMRVIADLVPNHTSDAHPWFVEAQQDSDASTRDYYIWRDPADDGGPPNNWLSHFGGPAWTLDETSGQYYCHLFLPEQPDLNWRNPAVHDEFDKILRFWLDLGLDGFRIDVAQALYKDEHLRDDPVIAPLEHAVSARDRFECLDHRYDLMQPETLDVFRRWRAIAEDYDAVLVGETYVLTSEELAALVPGDGLDVGFWFRPMHMQWSAAEVRETLRKPVEDVGGTVGWVLSSHDSSRPVARFGGGDMGRRRSMGLSTLLFGLPGVPFLYQGEELGLDDAELAPGEAADPLEVRNDDTPGRDVCRTPMPWQPGHNLGFSSADSTWLPVAHTASDTAAAQRDDPSSHLRAFRELVALRHALAIPPDEPVQWMPPGDLVGFWRGDVMFVLNMSGAPKNVPAEGDVELLFCTDRRADNPTRTSSGALVLDTDVAAIVRRRNG